MFEKLVYPASFVFLLSLVLTIPAEAELVGWWKLDDGSGTTAIDNSGNGNDGTLTAGTAGFPEWKSTADDFRAGTGALEFHGGGAAGEGDLVDCGNSAIFDITENITFALWVKIDAFTMTYQYVFSKGHQYMILRANDTPYLRVVFNGLDTGDGDDYYAGGTTIPIDDGQWHHVAASYDISTGIVAFYTDGILEESKTTSGSIPLNTDSVCIGRRNESNRKGTDAIIDDVRLYNHTLSAVEIQAAMKSAPYPQASGPSPKDGALHMATWASLDWRAGDFAVSHDVYVGDDFDDVDNGTADTFLGNQTETTILAGFPGFAVPDGFTPGTTYYWRIDEVNDADPNSPWKGNIWSFSIPPKTAYFPDPADGAEFVDPNATLSWTAGDGAKLHTFYIGDSFDDVNNAAAGTPSGIASFNPGSLESEKVYYWRVDEFDGIETHKGDIWAFTTPGAVGNSQPANGAVDVPMIATLSWTPADNAASHELYFGTDADAVKNATTASPEYIGPRALGAESYNPGGLDLDGVYAWRVDEVYPSGTVKGLVWTFTTADFILVDNFESYDDVDPLPGEPGINRIFDKWIDGFGTATNGALVGNDMPPYAETILVHGGAQALVYRYDNANKTSEATLTLTYPRDWTEEGVTRLSLWFRGTSGNADERMFVALNGSAVVYHDVPAATQKTGWTEWVIDLQEFANQGVALTNVNTITIGFGTKNSPALGGTGTMHFDDIRLYRPEAGN